MLLGLDFEYYRLEDHVNAFILLLAIYLLRMAQTSHQLLVNNLLMTKIIGN